MLQFISMFNILDCGITVMKVRKRRMALYNHHTWVHQAHLQEVVLKTSTVFVIYKQKRNITPFVKNLHFAYFKIQLGDQDKKWAPHVQCKTCAYNLRQRFKGVRSSMLFGFLIICHEPQNHYSDSYFCMCKISW
jgi:hypothetical protein